MTYPPFIWLYRLDGAVAVEYDAAPELQARVIDKLAFQRALKRLAKAGLLHANPSAGVGFNGHLSSSATSQ